MLIMRIRHIDDEKKRESSMAGGSIYSTTLVRIDFDKLQEHPNLILSPSFYKISL